MPRRKPAPEIPPPEHLSNRAQQLWRDIVPRRARSPERLALLEVALQAYDRLQQCRELLAGGELLEKAEGSKMAHANPALKLEKEARAQFVKCWTALKLEFSFDVDNARIGGDEL